MGAVFSQAVRGGVPVSSPTKAALLDAAVMARRLDVARAVLQTEIGCGPGAHDRLLKSCLKMPRPPLAVGPGSGPGDAAGGTLSSLPGGAAWLLEQLGGLRGTELSPDVYALVMRRATNASELRAVAEDVSAAALWDQRLLNRLAAEFVRVCDPLEPARQRGHVDWFLPLVASVHSRKQHLGAQLAGRVLRLFVAAQHLRACASLHRVMQRARRQLPLAAALEIPRMVVAAPRGQWRPREAATETGRVDDSEAASPRQAAVIRLISQRLYASREVPALAECLLLLDALARLGDGAGFLEAHTLLLERHPAEVRDGRRAASFLQRAVAPCSVDRLRAWWPSCSAALLQGPTDHVSRPGWPCALLSVSPPSHIANLPVPAPTGSQLAAL